MWQSSLLEHCPKWGKDDGDYDSPIKSGWDSRLYKKIKEAKEAQIKNERKREKGQCYYPFSTLVLQSSTMFFMIESLLCCHFHILVGIFHYRTWLLYSNDRLPQIALGLHEQASWMHTNLVFVLSFHKLIALVHPLHGNSYSLTLISIDGHLRSPLIRQVMWDRSEEHTSELQSRWLAASMWDFLPFCLLHTTSIIILYSTHSVCPWLALMYCVRVEKAEAR